ncbi:MAG: PAS domain S-box protein, partial [Nitrococcus sp.]|nr:PAS domain S-box protein [Nitrococcus sp.]
MSGRTDGAVGGSPGGMLGDAELRAVFDAAVDAIVVSDDQGRILAFSAAAERLFGHREAEVIGKNVDLLMPEPHRSKHAGYMRRYLETGEARIIGIGREVAGLHSSGEIFPIALSIGEALSDGRRRFVGNIRDLRAKRAAELNVRSLEARLVRVDRLNLMGEMVAGIAHEIN